MYMIAPTSSGEKGHIYARLESPNGPQRTIFLEDLPMWEKRYKSIPSMNDHLPCQFLHVHLPLSVPGLNGIALDQALETQLRVTSVQALALTSITSIYCHGDLVITYEDALCPLPLDGSLTSLNHQNFYDVPFGSDFWTMLLRGGQDGVTEPNLRKTVKGRQAVSDMLPGFSVIQEFVVPSEHGQQQLGSNGNLSPGSAMGDVVLVVLYDLEVSKGMKAQTGEISFLSLRKSSAASPPSHLPPLPPPNYTSYSHSSTTEVPQLVIPSDYYSEDASSLDTARPLSHSAHKPNLSLHIPPPPRFNLGVNGHATTSSSAQPSPSILSATGPITPWGQVVHTPTHPPPVLPPPSAVADAQRDRSRLEAAWRSNAAESNNRWDLDSPALYAPPPPPPSHSLHQLSNYGFYDIDHHHQSHLEPEAGTSNSSLSSFAMDRRSLSTPVYSTTSSLSFSTSGHYEPRTGANLLPPLPSPSTLTANFTNSTTAYSPSPLSFPSHSSDSNEIDYLNARPVSNQSLSSQHQQQQNVTKTSPSPLLKPTGIVTSQDKKGTVASHSEQNDFFSNLLGSTTR
jgi:hypothetical protein